MSSRVLVLPALEELEELLRPTLLKKTHERALYRFHLRAGDLRDFAITIYEAAGDLLEFKVTGNVGVDQDTRELSRGDDELGNKIDGVVTVTTEILGDGLVGSELAVQLRANQG